MSFADASSRREERPWPAILLCAVPLCVLASCGDGSSDRPRNAILITLDTTRADALGCYGGLSGVTPNLDSLAEDSLVYLNARTVAPITLPAHASMMTGLYPPRHGVHDNALTPVSSSAITLGERARERGFETMAIVGSLILDKRYGLDQGFETYDQPGAIGDAAVLEYRERPAVEVVEAAQRWLRSRDDERPFFLWLHIWDPHQPHDPAERFLSRAGGDEYLAEVAEADDALGRLFESLKELGPWNDTLLMVTSDHGEGRGDHGERTHATCVFDTTLRVPLIVHYPDEYGSGERSDELVTVADVYPTLVDALDLGAHGDIDGASLFRREVQDDRGVYFESHYGALNFQWSPIVGWVERGGKYVHCSQPETYDVSVDSKETANLFPRGDEHLYRTKIEEVLERTPLVPDTREFDRARVPILEALGYVGGPGRAVLDPLAVGDLPAPHRRNAELEKITSSDWHARAGNLDEAIRLLQWVFEHNPNNHVGLSSLGKYLMEQGRYAEALVPLQRFSEVGPKWAEVHFRLAYCLKELERLDEAIEGFEHVIEIDPQHIAAMAHVVDCHRRLGREDEAQAALELLERTKRAMDPKKLRRLTGKEAAPIGPGR